MNLIIVNQKLVIAEILGMKSRIETLERQDINKNVAIDIVVESLLHQKRIIQQKLNQVDESLFYLNFKLASRNDEMVKPKEAADKKIVKICRFNRTGFCREREKCPYFHGIKVCQEFLDSGVCMKQKCCERHPKRCIYFQRGECEWGSNCKYLHIANVKIVQTDEELDISNSEAKIVKDSKQDGHDDNTLDSDETIESIMAKARAFEDDDDDTLDYDETIESIMAKARAFEDSDESESES